MIDPATGWFEMAQIPNKTAAEIADITEKTWFTSYPLPQRIVFDRGTKFMAEFAKMCHNDYGLKRKPITTRKPQSNEIIELIHQTIGNIIYGIPKQNTPSVNTLTGEPFAQQSTTCVRSVQHAKEQKLQIINIANCHLNRLRQIPGILYV